MQYIRAYLAAIRKLFLWMQCSACFAQGRAVIHKACFTNQLRTNDIQADALDLYVTFLHGSRHLTKSAWELVIGPNLYRNDMQADEQKLMVIPQTIRDIVHTYVTEQIVPAIVGVKRSAMAYFLNLETRVRLGITGC